MDRELPREPGFWCWRDNEDGVGVCFAGRGPDLEVGEAARALAPPGVEPAWLEQVHSASVIDAVAGCAGRADALVTRKSALALVIVTADCVPVLVAGPGDRGDRALAAAHAGWRGIAGGIVPAAVDRLGAAPGQPTAWIGPAIGRCCYEVGEEVVGRVVSSLRDVREGEVVVPGSRGRPHLDLRAVVERQLRERGVTRIRHADLCTRCDDNLWSYRRDGRAAGRNLALIYST